MRLADTSRGLEVVLGGLKVGTLAKSKEGLIAFQYDSDWLSDGYSINPYNLPLTSKLFMPEWQPFGGLFGVFHDSLPDGWGALLLDRMLRREGLNPSEIDPLDRLAFVGSSGRGALEYRPQSEFSFSGVPSSLDDLAFWCQEILDDRSVENLDAVFAAGGMAGGARPKVYVNDDEGSWIVKFPSRFDPERIGVIEYEYALAAKTCGIEVPEVKLFPSPRCEGYFGTRRFDVLENGERRHMLSASAIVEVSHHLPSLDYKNLFQISTFLGGSQFEAKRLFRLMCFNVFAHNQDGHSNNFTWLCDHKGNWSLSPAYDLTYSNGMGGEHATSVLGNGLPEESDLLTLAKEVGLSENWSPRTVREIREVSEDLLSRLHLR